MMGNLVVTQRSTFQVGKGKEGCGRVVVRKQLGIVNAYTMEASFMGADRVRMDKQRKRDVVAQYSRLSNLASSRRSYVEELHAL